MRGDLGAHELAIRGFDREPAAAALEPLEVVVEPANVAVDSRHRLEQTVAVSEAAVGRIHAGFASVDEPESLQAVRRLAPITAAL
jgi:hypothetical protein